MPDQQTHGLSSDFFMPHGHCYLWQPSMLWLQVSSNVLIGLSYVAIATTLAVIVARVQDIPFRAMYLAFGVFIITCGLTHFSDAWVIWTPDYWFDGGLRAVTAAASVGTALSLPPLVPKVVSLARGAKTAHDRGVALETAMADLGRMYEKTRELEQLKTQFFANVSHELRTPLTLILGPVERLRDATNLTDAQRRDLDLVFRNGRTLLKHVNDLLEIARLEAGKVTAQYVDVDLAKVLRVVAGHFDSIAEERGIAYEVLAPPSLPATLDSGKIERVLLNLLSNAFKFTPAGGRVVCELDRHVDPAIGRALAIRVSDTGPGIPVNLREAVFERFRQLDMGPNRAFGGTGLGLAICKEFVELHGGRILVGEAVGGGALFTVILPENAPPGVEVRPWSEEHDHASMQSALVTLNDLRAKVLSIGIDEDDDRPTVLVVDDNDDMRRFVADTLSDTCRTVMAGDGREGLEKALETLPDLVLTDVMMPRLSGDRLIAELRSRPVFNNVPIILLSAKADDELRLGLLKAGAQDYVMKPFSPEELKARVANLLKMKRAHDVLQHELSGQLGDLERLARDVAAKKRDLETAIDSLRVARDHAEKASAVKTNFLRLVSHELRTPLTVARLQVDRLKMDATLSAPQLNILGRLASSLLRLTELVDAVLEHTRIESGRLSTSQEEFDIAELVGEVVDETRPVAEQKQLAIGWRASDALPPALSDRRLLRLILSNLVGNALKFTERGSVEITVEMKQGEYRISVSDTGPGIAPESQQLIFEPFSQLEPLKNKHTPGVGLGLSLVREMTAALGGVIELRSKPGEGSTFTVRLPTQPKLVQAAYSGHELN